MTFHVFFAFSTGLSKPIKCPRGTMDSIMANVKWFQEKHGVPVVDGRVCQRSIEEVIAKMTDEDACDFVERHNIWVRHIYRSFAEWGENPVKNGEKITPKMAETFWHALVILDVPPDRWTGTYYKARMDSIYEALRGRTSEDGLVFSARKKLTIEQADEVIGLLSSWLDHHDVRLMVPEGRDQLASMTGFECEWCSTCNRAIHNDDADKKLLSCRKRDCDLKEEYADYLYELKELRK